MVHANKDKVDAAMRSVTPEDVRFFRTLVWVRGLNLPRASRPRPPVLHLGFAPGLRSNEIFLPGKAIMYAGFLRGNELRIIPLSR